MSMEVAQPVQTLSVSPATLLTTAFSATSPDYWSRGLARPHALLTMSSMVMELPASTHLEPPPILQPPPL